MLKPNGNIITALCTACSIVAFAFYERSGAAVRVPAVALFVAAAVICLLPVLYGVVRHRACCHKTTVG